MSLNLLVGLLGLALTAQSAPQPEQEEAPLVIPWQVQIYSSFANWTEEQLATRDGWDLAHKCGGSLIAPGWVLTAAHCINHDRIKNGHRVRLGASTINRDEGATYLIDRMVRHADYSKDKKSFDIALVHFVADDRTVEDGAGPIEAIPLYTGPPLEPGIELYATGWGKLEEGADNSYQASLSQADLVSVDCGAYPELGPWTAAYHLCAAGVDADNDTCEGDSGGPLVIRSGRPLLVGVVNFGFGCYRGTKPGVYLRIDSDNFRDWIDRAMAVDPSVSELR